MPTPKLLAQLQALADDATNSASEYSGVIGTIKEFIVSNFGETGLISAYIASAILLLFIVSRVAKLTFSALKYLLIPSIALAFLATLFFPMNFAAALPISVTVCSLFLLFKG